VSAEPRPVTVTVNGEPRTAEVEPRLLLVHLLREKFSLTGTHIGCDTTSCGACTVHLDGRRILSCLTLAATMHDRAITTIEGIGSAEALHPVQQAFIEHDGFQCGYCTPGQIMSAAALVREPLGDSEDAVREAMSGNICRCGAYPNILAAVRSVRSRRS